MTVKPLAGLFMILALCVMVMSGFRLYVVTSGSMAPAIPTGSMILVSREPFSGIREGNIVTYRLNGGDTVVTHRVVAVDSRKKDLRTKGDANALADPVPVSDRQIIGVVRMIVPYLGIIWVRSGRLLLAVVIILVETIKWMMKEQGGTNKK